MKEPEWLRKTFRHRFLFLVFLSLPPALPRGPSGACRGAGDALAAGSERRVIRKSAPPSGACIIQRNG